MNTLRNTTIVQTDDIFIEKNAKTIFPVEFLDKINYTKTMSIKTGIQALNSRIPTSKKTFVSIRKAMKTHPFLDWQKLENWVKDELVETLEFENDPSDPKYNLIITKKVTKYALEDFAILVEKEKYLDLAMSAGALARINTLDGTKWVWRNVRRWDMKDQTNEVRVLADMAASWFGRLAYLHLIETSQNDLTDDEFNKFIDIINKAVPNLDQKTVKKYSKKLK